MTMFDSFRGENGFTFYANHESPNTIDKPLVVVTYFCVLVAVATLLATFGVRGKDKWYCVIRASYSVAVGSIILVCIVSQHWKEGYASVQASPYVYRSDLQFKGDVGVLVGLTSANVTLEGSYLGSSGKRHDVDYRENLDWADFGQERHAYIPILQRGLPEPILKAMEFLTMNEGGLRWGTTFHYAGQITSALLWTAFTFWVLTNALLFSVIVYGAYMFFFTGLSLLMACVAYHACQSETDLVILFGDQVLELTYGWCFWLALVTGACTTILGAVLILSDHFLPDAVAEFFHFEKAITEYDQQEEYLMMSAGPQAQRAASFNAPRGSISRQLTPTHLGDHQRKGSIFLEPERERRRASIKDSLFKKAVTGASMEQDNKGFEGDTASTTSNSDTKMNPIFVGDQEFHYTDEELKMAEMEKVCERGPFSMKDGKASLATMKELRDNHANERKANRPGGSLQSSPGNSRTNSFSSGRPRAGSDATPMIRPPAGYRPGSVPNVVFHPPGDDVDASRRGGAAIRPTTLEVEVETHSSAAPSDVDLQTPTDLTPQDSDNEDRRSSMGSVFSPDGNATLTNHQLDDVVVMPDDSFPPPPPPTTQHFETPQITIQIDSC